MEIVITSIGEHKPSHPALSSHILRRARREVEQNGKEKPDYRANSVWECLPFSGHELHNSLRCGSRESALVTAHFDEDGFDQLRLLRHEHT